MTGWLVHEGASYPIPLGEGAALLGIHNGVAAVPIVDVAAVAK